MPTIMISRRPRSTFTTDVDPNLAFSEVYLKRYSAFTSIAPLVIFSDDLRIYDTFHHYLFGDDSFKRLSRASWYTMLRAVSCSNERMLYVATLHPDKPTTLTANLKVQLLRTDEPYVPVSFYQKYVPQLPNWPAFVKLKVTTPGQEGQQREDSAMEDQGDEGDERNQALREPIQEAQIVQGFTRMTLDANPGEGTVRTPPCESQSPSPRSYTHAPLGRMNRAAASSHQGHLTDHTILTHRS